MDRFRRSLIFGTPLLAFGAAARAQGVFTEAPAQSADRPVAAMQETFRHVKEYFVSQTIEATKVALAQESATEALRWEGEFPQSALFRAIDIPILPDHLEGTKYDYADLRRRYPVQFGLGTHRHEGSPRLIAAIDKDQDPIFKREGYLSENYGNCFYWNTPDTIVTTEHLAERFPESRHFVRKDGWDVSVANVAARFASHSPEQVIHDDASVSDAEINGSLVCIVGRDPDASGDMEGAKIYPGIAVKMTPAFIRGVLAEIPAANRRGMSAHDYDIYIRRMRERMTNSYMVMLPLGEARANSEGELPCQGMSASPVFGFIRGEYRPVGVFFSAMCLEDALQKRDVDVGFFHPVSAIRKLAADKKSRWTLK